MIGVGLFSLILDQDGLLVQTRMSELEIYLSILIPTGFCTCTISQLVVVSSSIKCQDIEEIVVSSQIGFTILHNIQTG